MTVGATVDSFYVADNGPRSPEEEREQVFEAGYSTSEGGIGLSIVRRMVGAHGWEVSVTDTDADPDAGSGVWFDVTGTSPV